MKFAAPLLFSVAFALLPAAAQEVDADAPPDVMANASSVVLSNGAVLSTKISQPQTNDTYITENNYTEPSWKRQRRTWCP